MFDDDPSTEANTEGTLLAEETDGMGVEGGGGDTGRAVLKRVRCERGREGESNIVLGEMVYMY